MADLIAAASGNFTAAGTWQTVDTASLLDPTSPLSYSVSTTPLDSQTFVLPAVAVDAVCLRRVTRGSGTPTGGATFTVTLRNSTTSTDVKSVTVNITDVFNDGNGIPFGFVTFKFASSHTPNGTDSYLIRVVCSTAGSSNTVTLLRNSTASNCCRRIRTTTTQAPASGNHLVISNELTGAGTSNAITVTMDNTATTSFGPTVSGGPFDGIDISGGGTLTCENSASKNYYLKWKGILNLDGNGTVNIGTSGSRLDSSSTAVLEMDSAANVDTGIKVGPGGTFNAYGATKATVATLMTANKAVAATVITLASTSGWAVSDELAFAPTTRTASEVEKKTILTVDSSTQVTLTAGLTNARSGTSPTQAEVINLTRNLKIRGVSTSLQGYLFLDPKATATFSYAELYQLGSATANKRGIDIGTTTGTVLFEYCGIHDFIVASSTIYLQDTGTLNNFTFDHCGFYNCAGNGNTRLLQMNTVTSGSNWSITNNIFLGPTGDHAVIFNVANVLGNVTGNTIAGSGSNGFYIDGNTGTISNFANNTVHSNAGRGVYINNQDPIFTVPISLTAWRNNDAGLLFNSRVQGFTITGTFFGNATYNIYFGNSASNIIFDTLQSSGDSTFSTTSGINLPGINLYYTDFYFYNCTFSPTSGIYVAHTQDILLSAATHFLGYANKSTFSAATVVSGLTALLSSMSSSLRCQDFTTGIHKSYFVTGIIIRDNVIFNAGSPSERLTPNSATKKLKSGCFQTAVPSSGNRTINVTVRKSVVGDAGGANYNGNQPRLILKRNDAAGVTADTILATATTSGWETLSGTFGPVSEDCVLEVYVDCDGTAGWINVDDWATS